MNHTKSMGYVKLAAALVLSLLMAPSPAVAESDYLYQFNPDRKMTSARWRGSSSTSFP